MTPNRADAMSLNLGLKSLIASARKQDASDLHLEAGLPATLRIRGALRAVGEPLSAPLLLQFAHELIDPTFWPKFELQRSFDLSKTIAGVRCRINVLHTARGVGMAIRLLAAHQISLQSLNLHPDLSRFIGPSHGLVLVSGPTGSGKSSTLAAFIQEINLAEARHIVTIENPIEYTFRPRRSFIRQREVGRDTPSFEQALLDALREDPDVLMVGELREPETMRLTLSAAETGHLVLATVHSGTCAEALQRIVSAFPSEIQNNVAAQLADCLVGVVSQRLRFREDLNLRVPECEVLTPSTAIKAFIRSRDFFKIPQVLETGADHGMWTFQRYQSWLTKRSKWHVPSLEEESLDEDDVASSSATLAAPQSSDLPRPTTPSVTPCPPTPAKSAGRIEITPVEGGLEGLLKRLE